LGGEASVFVSIDAEGLPYVPSKLMLSPGDPLWGELRKIMTWVAGVIVDTVRKTTDYRVVIADSHGVMLNINPLEISPRGGWEIVRGFPRPTAMIQGAKGSAAALLVGYHTSQGTGGVLAHTYAGRIVQRVSVYDFEDASELVLNAYALAEMGVPIALVAGDEGLKGHAERVAPDAVFLPLKRAVASTADVSPAPADVEKKLAEAVIDALGKVEGLNVACPREPWFVVEFKRPWHADLAESFPCVERIDGVRVRLACQKYLDNYALFEGLVVAAYGLEKGLGSAAADGV